MNPGNNPRWTWDQYQEETGTPDSEADQRAAIIHTVDQFYSQGDYWSLNAVRILLRLLVEAEPKSGYALLCILHDLDNLTPHSLELAQKFLSALTRP